MKEEVKKLWRICFPEDSEDFIELYFSMRYTDDITSAIIMDGNVVSSLQRIPYSMAYKGDIIPVSYISGACTHPSRRGIGLMTRLLKEAHRKMYDNGIYMSTLIPANNGLVDFYKGSEYSIIFNPEEKIMNQEICCHTINNIEFNKVSFSGKETEEISEFIYKYHSEKSSCILHTKEDMDVIIADHLLSDGEIWMGRNIKGNICSVIFTIKEKDKVQIKELASDSKDTEKEAIGFILRHYGATRAIFGFPCGMARVINALEMLKIYSQEVHESKLIEVYGDEEITENNGYYLMSERKCTKLPDNNRTSNIEITRIHISELSQLLFKGEKPYMSLMLN